MLSFGNSLLTCLAQKSKKQKGEKEPFSLAIFFSICYFSVVKLLFGSLHYVCFFLTKGYKSPLQF